MVDYDAAKTAIERTLAAMPACFPGDSWIVMHEHTIERVWGWVLFFDSRLHHETGNAQYTVAGNATYIVRRSDGAVFLTGTAYPIEHYIHELESDGTLS